MYLYTHIYIYRDVHIKIYMYIICTIYVYMYMPCSLGCRRGAPPCGPERRSVTRPPILRVLNSRTTASQRCEAVPGRCFIQGS